MAGGNARDVLDGGRGNDLVEGGTGNDELAGGGGTDTFEFDAGDGRDTIVDWAGGTDLIDLVDFDYSRSARSCATPSMSATTSSSARAISSTIAIRGASAISSITTSATGS